MRYLLLLLSVCLASTSYGQTFQYAPVSVMTETKTVQTTPQQPISLQRSGPVRYTQQELFQIALQYYPQQRYYVRYADVQPRSSVYMHLTSGGQHSFTQAQVGGLPLWAALAIHDLDHGGRIRPWKTVQRPVQQTFPIQPMQPTFQSGCANGQCPPRFLWR